MLKFTSCYHLDREKGELSNVTFDKNSPDYESYIATTIKEIIDNVKTKEYGLDIETNIVFKKILESLKCKTDTEADDNHKEISKKLLIIETERAKRVAHLNGLQKGSLLQENNDMVKDKEDKIYYLITKVEHDNYLDDTDSKTHSGLPYRKKILKSCLYIFDTDMNLQNVKVGDSSGSSEYWWHDFLDLIELGTDEASTIKAYDAADKILKRNIENKSKEDYMIVRNNLNGYFLTADIFDSEKMAEYVIGSIEFSNDNVKKDRIKQKLIDIPKNSKIDGSFSIKSDSIKNKIRSRYKLNPKIDLVIKDWVKDISDVLTPVKKDGEDYVMIKVSNKKNIPKLKGN